MDEELMPTTDNVAKLLLESDISFSKGTYTTEKQISKTGFKPEDLMKHFAYANPNSPRNVRYTVNDIPIPTPVLEHYWFYDPRERVTELQDSVRKIYIEDEIENIAKNLKTLDTGEKNIIGIINSIAAGKVTLPKEYPVEGIKTAVNEGEVIVSVSGLPNKDSAALKSLQKEKDFLNPLITLRNIDDILSIDASKIAAEWKYRMPKVKPKSF